MIRDSKEHRSALGRLLAREDITVNHGNYKTAFFDVKNRVLGLPDWDDKSKSVYDLLLGHEVGHALYTPLEALESVKGLPHFDVINIVEDVRIERMIQQTYPGLPRYFKEGYTELWNDGFFGVDQAKLEDLNFLDRLNLHAKVGSTIDIPLNDEEKDLYNECYAAETFDDVMKIYQKIVDRLEDEKKEKEEEEMKVSAETSADTPDSDDSGEEGEEQSGNAAREYGDDDFIDDGTEAESADEASDNEPSGVTDEDIEQAMEELLNEKAASENEADEISEFISQTQRNFDETLEEDAEEKIKKSVCRSLIFPRRKKAMEVVTPYSQLKEERLNHLKEREMTLQDVFDAKINKWDYDLCEYKDIEVYSSYKNFVKESSKKVGVLVREFERKKAAYQYSRATTSRSGVIDVNRMHSYKYDDNIFASVSHLADAKSHGMIFLIDNSGSMGGQLGHVINQTLMLTEFCDKVGIPYEVYSYTDMRPAHDSSEAFIDEVLVDGIEMINVLSSSLKKKEKHIARVYLYGRGLYDINQAHCFFQTEREGWGGTPLNTCLMITSYLIDDFRAKHPVQKLNLLTLSDGDSHAINTNGWASTSYYKIKHEGKTYRIGARNSNGQTTDVNEMIADAKDVTMIGFFIPQGRQDAREKVRRSFDRYWDNDTDVLMRKYKKENHLELKNVYGYDAYYIMPSNPKPVLHEDFNVEITDKNGKSMAKSSASQSKLAREFAKHNTDAKNSRILMEKFATLIG